MNELAKNSGLSSASSLYRYVNGKKELWDYICLRDFTCFRDGLLLAVQQNKNPEDAVYAMGKFFIEFGIEDYHRLERMFLTPPPPDLTESDETNNCEPITDENKVSGLEVLITSVSQALEENEIEEDPIMVSHYLWALVLGTSLVILPSELGFAAPYMNSKEHTMKFKEFVLEKSRLLYDKKYQ